MNNPEILSNISIALTAIVGIILYRQIKSQQQIIGQYKDFLQTLDLNKSKEFHELDKKAILSNFDLQLNNFYQKTAADTDVIITFRPDGDTGHSDNE